MSSPDQGFTLNPLETLQCLLNRKLNWIQLHHLQQLESFSSIVTEVLEKKLNMGRTIIYCRTMNDCASLYLFFKQQLGKDFLHPSHAPDLSKYRLVDMYTSCTETTVKNTIVQAFTCASPLGLVITTVAFGIGVDCPHVSQVVHLGAPGDIELWS